MLCIFYHKKKTNFKKKRSWFTELKAKAESGNNYIHQDDE